MVLRPIEPIGNQRKYQAASQRTTTTTNNNSTTAPLPQPIKMNATFETQEQPVVVFAEAVTALAQEDPAPLLIAEAMGDAFCYIVEEEDDTIQQKMETADLKPDKSYGLTPLMGWVCVGVLGAEVMTRTACYLRTA